ncbi:GIY-YIG nuclease family protein [Acidisoma cladoniae]|uniref:GIY-YIG nuclease family protein n=1 Tax=Acidisoma cladoniae TaxID=3040935 RepID=UPI002550E1A5|nr:GIY-YIG nuclease family protein [Acidisoma sp. PAMC 29798]
MTDRPNGVLYIGVTADLARRVWQHREGFGSDFTHRYGLHRLVHAESHETILQAIAREKALKRWPRAWKVRLIERGNANWNDLYDSII